MEPLQVIVERLSRPIQFASRDAYAHLSAVKNLGSFVSGQVVRALSGDIYPTAVETDLLALRQLFADFDDHLKHADRKRRLAAARVILKRLGSVDALDETKDGRRSTFDVKGTFNVRETPNLEPRAAPPTAAPWTVPIRFAKGVGPKRARLLAKVGIHTVEDALWYVPWRYEDRSVVTPIGQLAPGARATICGSVRQADLKRTRRRGLTIFDVIIEDSTGDLRAVFYNQPYLEKLLKPGSRAMMCGLVSVGRRGWADLRMEAPHYEVLGDEAELPLHVGRIVPIYHETKGLTSRQLRVLQKGVLDLYRGGLEDVLPPTLRDAQRLPVFEAAVAAVHFPSPEENLDSLNSGGTAWHRRLAYEELFLLELALAARHRSVKVETKGIQFDTQTVFLQRLRELLPFSLTPAQERVLSEIQRDMAAPRPMNRLIQGDVGSGKTVVALAAMLIACGSGYQSALMVPTEILAEQHYVTLRKLIRSLGLEVVWLKSGGVTKARTAVLRAIEMGSAHIVIGTHALIQKGVRFARLGLVVIDEQHKFGVLQRKTFLEKGYHPDVLVLTATPIPRTLAMTVYGDLDVSVIDALPPGRKPVRTLLFHPSERRRAYQLLLDEVRAGRQGYIVYPLVEESEKVDLQAAMQAVERLRVSEFRDVRLGLIHGRLSTEEKEGTMAAFKAGEIQVLAATTVVEVGVDVPNSTVMLVEHAERFGLAQLHQLRGRVGRGAQQSYCLLLMSARTDLEAEGQSGRGQSSRRHGEISGPTSAARQRLEALVKSTDGFVIAEEDLRLRGPGEFFGVRQWGLPEFRVASLLRDRELLGQARKDAFRLLASDPGLAQPSHRLLRAALLRRWQAKLELGSVS
jgi:ATP-dependent DNA helicase RecG